MSTYDGLWPLCEIEARELVALGLAATPAGMSPAPYVTEQVADALAARDATITSLRAEVSLLQQEARIRRHISDGLAAEVAAERAAVVAWLRRRTRSGRRRAFSPAFITDAAAIEHGEHRLKERK